MPEARKKKPLSVGSCLADLNKHAENVKINIKNAEQCRQYCVSVNQIFKKADARYHDGDEENSYILFMRYFHILGAIKKTYEYQRQKKQYDEILIPNYALKAIERAESLSNSLKLRYAQLKEDTTSLQTDKAGKSNADQSTVKRSNDVVDGASQNDANKDSTRKADFKNDKSKQGNSEEHHVIHSLPDVPSFDNSTEIQPESKIGPKIDPWITPEELYQLLRSSDPNSILIIDTRPPVDYESSHIKHNSVINIQEDLLKPGANVNSIERRLPSNIWEVWISRNQKSHVIIMDAETKRDDIRSDQPVQILKDAIYKRGSVNSLETEPRLLDSGFYGWFLYYPSICTNPFYKKPKSKSSYRSQDTTSLLSNLEYPKLPGLGSKSLSESGLHNPSNKDTNQSTAGLNGAVGSANLEARLDRSMSETTAKIGHNSVFNTNDDEDILDKLRRQISSPHLPGDQPGYRDEQTKDLINSTNKAASSQVSDTFRARQGSLDKVASSRIDDSFRTRHGSLDRPFGPNGYHQRNQDAEPASDAAPKRPPPPKGSTLPPPSSPDFKRRFGPSESLTLPPSPLSDHSGEPHYTQRPAYGSSLSYTSHGPHQSPSSSAVPTASTSNPTLNNVGVNANANYFPSSFERSRSLPQPHRQHSGPSGGSIHPSGSAEGARRPGSMGAGTSLDNDRTTQYLEHDMNRPSNKDSADFHVNPTVNGRPAYGPQSLPNDITAARSPGMSPTKSRPNLPHPASSGQSHVPPDNHPQATAPPRDVTSPKPGATYMSHPIPSTTLPQSSQSFTQPRPSQPPPRPTAGPTQNGGITSQNIPGKPGYVPQANQSMSPMTGGQAVGHSTSVRPTTVQSTAGNQNVPKSSGPGQTVPLNLNLPQPASSEPTSGKPHQRPLTASATLSTDSRGKEPEFMTSPGLPNGWEKRIDDRTGRVYYIDHLSKSTHWELPPDFYAVRHKETMKQKRKAPEVPGTNNQISGAKDNLSPTEHRLPVTKEEPKSSMKRSLSTPNLADLAENKENLQPQRPVIDRSSKPLQTNTQLVDRSNKPLSKTRLTSLSPVYGSKGRNLTGLKNLGNTCYMNSVIQALSNTNPLAMYFFSGTYTRDLNQNSMNRRPEEVAKELAFLVKVLWSGQYRSISPCDFKSAIGRFASQFAGTKQQDAHEFLMFFMDGLHEDTNKVKRKTPMKEQNNDNIPEAIAASNAWKDYTKSNNSIIVDLFQGQFRSTVACQTCNKKSVTFDVFSCLPLQLTSKSSCSLDDCIRSFTRPEMIGGNNSWKCSGCKAYREATKTIELWKLPPVIIVQLKRFSSDGIWHNKLQTNVNFPVNDFNISKYSVGNRPEVTSSYNLFAIINHYGSFESGHYTAYCRNQGKWYCYDDNVVRDIGVNSIKTSAAYLLFYTTMDFIY